MRRVRVRRKKEDADAPVSEGAAQAAARQPAQHLPRRRFQLRFVALPTLAVTSLTSLRAVVGRHRHG